jgi:FtsP/CotA-like multicopper oxidase with cupredoxin domain
MVLRDMNLQSPRAFDVRGPKVASLSLAALMGKEPIAATAKDLASLKTASVLEMSLGDVIGLGEAECGDDTQCLRPKVLLKDRVTAKRGQPTLLAGGAAKAVAIELALVKVRQKVGGYSFFVKQSGQKAVTHTTMRSALLMAPAKDVSLNNVPVLWKPTVMAGGFTASGVIKSAAGQKEFWRIANASAGSYFKLQLRERVIDADGKASSRLAQFSLVALDGIPVSVATGHVLNSSGAIERGKESIELTEILLPPGGRAELIATMPTSANSELTLVSAEYDTQADWNPERTLARVELGLASSATNAERIRTRGSDRQEAGTRFSELSKPLEGKLVPAAVLYFSQKEEGSSTKFFFDPNLDDTRKLYSVSNTPIISARLGTRPIWKIVNADYEAHAFHIHQIRFKVLERNGKLPNELEQSTFRDTIDLEPCSKAVDAKDMKTACPSVTLEMDFSKGDIVGNFPLHCHILEHEDGGMMAIMKVLPAERSGRFDQFIDQYFSAATRRKNLVDLDSAAICRAPVVSDTAASRRKAKQIIVTTIGGG